MFVRDPRTGRVVQVQDVPTGRVNPGMSREQYERMMSTLPEAEIAGAVGPGVVPSNAARQAQGGIIRQPPPTWRPLAGSAPNNRGNTIIITPPTLTAVNETFDLNATVVETQRPAGEDAEVVAICVQSNPVNASDALAFPNSILTSMFCELTWGIGGASFTTEIDWGRGVSLVLPASFIRVRAFYRGIATVVAAGTPPPMSFSAGLAYGYVGGKVVNGARLTTAIGSFGAFGLSAPLLAGATSGLIEVPAFASAFNIPSVGDTPAGAPNLLVRQLSGNTAGATTLAIHTVAAQTNLGNQLESAFPIVDGCKAITITNNAAFDTTPRVLWNLSL